MFIFRSCEALPSPHGSSWAVWRVCCSEEGLEGRTAITPALPQSQRAGQCAVASRQRSSHCVCSRALCYPSRPPSSVPPDFPDNTEDPHMWP
ncbi:hypothetical protein O3P69_004754 [Scylla paramamosain]|uniref:Uncharacterized protein n=1 Tax=Scylla paramamosain TaxID=85552 RepID=A0AAW0UC66_SCYPA